MNAGNARLLDRLVADGIIRREQQEQVLNVIARSGERAEDALLELKVLEEAQLLRYLATQHRTRFVSTEKLARADIDRRTLDKVPKKLAERKCVFPVLFDPDTGQISIVTPDPDDPELLHDVQVASGARGVRAFVGRPRAIRAAINKAYNGDVHAFATLDREAHAEFTSMHGVYERTLGTVAPPAREPPPERTLTMPAPPVPAPAAPEPKARHVDETYLETLNVLVTLLENQRPDLRGHSAHVARLMQKISERIGLANLSGLALQAAGYLHDLGKMDVYHLTALNVAEYESHRSIAQKRFRAPASLLEAVKLPPEIRQAIELMYERYDGAGLPSGHRGKEIPLGARLLAIVDTYADLTQNPKNPFRKVLSSAQACEVLQRYRGTVFDPNLVDLFEHMVAGDDLKTRLLANRRRALVIDPDPEETTVLELRLIEQGFEVLVARSAEQALRHIERGDIDIVVSEIDLPEGDGFSLLADVRKLTAGEKLPWVFVTGRGGGSDAQRAFELGAADFMTKPVSPEVLVTKLHQVLEREARAGGSGRGVSGSLSEMGLPDMVQLLWHGRKTGCLRIRSGAASGEIHFVEGAIFNAVYANLRGEEAVYAMLALRSGDFTLDPNFRAPRQVITASPEAILLEGMRRLDEGMLG